MYEQMPGYPGHESGPQYQIDRVVIHGTVSPCVPGGAEANGRYFERPDSGGLAAYVVDPSKIVQCAPEDMVTWHAPPNKNSIGIELCDPQAGPLARWTDSAHKAMFALARPLVHDICQRHHVPLVFVDARGLMAGRRGVTTHYEVSQAFHQSDHSDPGPGFSPFMAYLLSMDAPHPAAHPLAAKTYPMLSLGSRGDAVKRLQQLLHLPDDGVFGPITQNAVKRFQHTRHLAVDGVAGPSTLATMRF